MISPQFLTTVLNNMTFNISLLIPLQTTCKGSDHMRYMGLDWQYMYSVKTENMFPNFVYYPLVSFLLWGTPL